MCRDEDNVKVPFISEEPSCEVKEDNTENTLFTLAVQVVNEEDFLKKITLHVHTLALVIFLLSCRR